MKIVVIGGVAGGMSAATRLRRLSEIDEITVIEKSGFVSYANCGLPYFIGGTIEKEEDLLLQTPESLHARFELDVRVNTEAFRIDPVNQLVFVKNSKTDDFYELPYDKLILSPGASAIVPNIPGAEQAFTLRTVEDAERIVESLKTDLRSVVIVGGGFIGIELVENFVNRGIKTTLIEKAEQVLPPVDIEMASIVLKELLGHGVDVRLNCALASISRGAVILDTGETLDADLVLLAVGVRPEISLARSAGLLIGPRGGIQVDSFNRTSLENIYAVGDAVEKTDALDGSATLVPLANLANRHGRVVADHINGRAVREVATIGTAIVKVFTLSVAITGWNESRLRKNGRGYRVIHTHPNSHAGYYPGSSPMSLKIIFDPQSGEILGAQGIGSEGVDKRIDVLATAILGGITAPELADLELAYAPPFGSAKDPINMLGYMAENLQSRLIATAQWSEVEDYRRLGYQFLDVRSTEEFSRGFIPGSINIPLDEIRFRRSEIGTKKVLVSCQVGQRGHTATLLLNQIGFEAVNLDGGYLTWMNSPAGLISKENTDDTEKENVYV